jgi:hypothetical protein
MNCLFIGGPVDGHQIEVPDGLHSVAVPEHMRPRAFVQTPTGPELQSEASNKTIYRRERLAFNDRPPMQITLFIAEGISTFDAFASMFEVYTHVRGRKALDKPMGRLS